MVSEIIDATRGAFWGAAMAGRYVIESSQADWQYGNALYLVNGAHLELWCKSFKQPTGYVACTSGNMDQRIELYLRWREMWKGRGPVVVFRNAEVKKLLADSGNGGQFRIGLGLLIHELAHVIHFRAVVRKPHDPYVPHGIDFTRAALHLWFRVTEHPMVQGVPSVCPTLDDLRICGQRYGMSEAALYHLALQASDEHKSLRNIPVGQIVSRPVPAVFQNLWNEDFARSNGEAGTQL